VSIGLGMVKAVGIRNGEVGIGLWKNVYELFASNI